MATLVVALAHHIEQEGVCVVVQGLMVQEQLGQQTEVLGIHFVFTAINFEERNRIFPVDFIARRMFEVALSKMSFKTDPRLDEFQAELADVDAGEAHQLDGVRGEVPRLNTMATKLYQFNIFHSCNRIVVSPWSCQ